MVKNLLYTVLATFVAIGCFAGDGDSQKKERQVSLYGKVDDGSLTVEVLPAMTYPTGSLVSKWGKLKVAKNANGVRCLCDENGNPVQLRGVSSHGLQWSGVANLTSANITTLSNDWNCSVFRIVLYVDEEGGYAYNESHRSRKTDLYGDLGHVENVVKWCGENGIYCLIDWHVHNPGNPQHEKYRNRRYPDTLEGIDLAADFFTYCARRFQNYKHVIYELCNEPNDNEAYQFKEKITWEQHIKPYCEDMLKIIRSYDKEVVVICGTPNWSNDLLQVIGKEPQDENGAVYDNLMYTFHFYAYTHNDGTVSGNKTNFMKLFTEGDPSAGIPSILATLPVFVTEWGTTDASGWTNFSAELSDRWLDIFDGKNDGKQVVSWCNWSFSAEGGECRQLNWNTGNIAQSKGEILSPSGKYIYNKLRKKKN